MNSIEYKIIYDILNCIPYMENNIASIIEQYIYKKCKVYQNETSNTSITNRNNNQIGNQNTEENDDKSNKNQTAKYITEYIERFDEIHGKYIKKETSTNRIIFERNYNYGKLNGEKIRYYSNGNIMKKENYVNDLLDGLCQKYSSNGIMLYSYTFKNGIQHGPFFQWHSTGEISSEGNNL